MGRVGVWIRWYVGKGRGGGKGKVVRVGQTFFFWLPDVVFISDDHVINATSHTILETSECQLSTKKRCVRVPLAPPLLTHLMTAILNSKALELHNVVE